VALFCVATLLAGGVVRANVYPTQVVLNGGYTNQSIAPGGNVTIGYTLNELASAGVTITIQSTNRVTLRTIALTNGAAGTMRGTNRIVWDGKDDNGSNAPTGSYSVSVTAAATGYGDWTQTSDDLNPGNYVYEPRGIAVNRNVGSPYYGRVFVANATAGPSSPVGLQKLNADGSYAADGGFSDGGWAWAGDDFSPWKIAVGADDRVYVDDFTGRGVVLSFDQTISSNSLQVVLQESNYPNAMVALSGPFVSGSGPNLSLWMANATGSEGIGIQRWSLPAGGMVATGDLGTNAILAGAGSDLSVAPFDVALDRSNRIYTIQDRSNFGDPEPRILRFPPFVDANLSETNAEVKIGAGEDTLAGAKGIAVNPAGTLVAVAFRGFFPPPSGPWVNGGVRIYANNGTNLDLVTTISPAASPSHDHWDVDWDNAGNLYTVDNYDSASRVYSPPGSNAATTVALALVQVIQSTPPVITTAPQGGTRGYGDSNYLSVAVSGTPPFAYQWQLNGVNIAGATGSSLSLAALQFTNAGLYTVIVSNAAGTVTSSIAVVNVFPRLSSQRSGQTLTLSWAGPFILQSALNVKGPFTDVTPQTNPYPVDLRTGAQKFYRLRSGPAVLTGTHLPDGTMSISSTGILGCNFVLQASTNLATWTNLKTNPSPFSLVDSNAAQLPRRYYRAVLAH
jgi:hypothetical protein